MNELIVIGSEIASCMKCPVLCTTRKNTVPGEGNPNARVMLIGEGPGADEDESGRPFVGRSGQLLNAILAACGWQREDVFIANVLKCRPPRNRTPEPVEVRNCLSYLERQ